MKRIKIKMVECKCDQCGKKLIRKPSESKYKNIFCDKKCRALWEKGQIKVDRKPCKMCGKKTYIPPIRYKRSPSGICYCSRKCYNMYRVKYKTSYNWIGGHSKSRGDDWEKVKKQVKKRDKNRCVRCGKSNCILHVHHMIPYRIQKTNEFDNLITLCNSCHTVEENKLYKILFFSGSYRCKKKTVQIA